MIRKGDRARHGKREVVVIWICGKLAQVQLPSGNSVLVRALREVAS